MKSVSIIMPVYNKGKYIERAIKSILDQTMQEFELLIVDDGSSDNSGEIADKWAKKDDRIEVLHIANGGVSNARNIALDNVTTDYITFMDADDYVGKSYLENLYNCIIKNQAELVISGYTKIWGKAKKEEQIKMPVMGEYCMNDILPYFAEWQKQTGLFGYCWAKIFKKNIVEGIYFDTGIKLAEDLDFYLKIYERVETIYFSNRTDYYYVQETDNCSSLVSDYEIDYLKQLELNFRYANFLKNQNVFNGVNQQILQSKICNYFYFSLFYCKEEKFNECFENLYRVYKEKGIVLKGETLQSKYFLFLLRTNNKCMAKLSLSFYRWLRKIKWNIKNIKRYYSEFNKWKEHLRM